MSISEQSRESEPLKVENSLDLLLVLLYAPGYTGEAGEPIQGITRLQKLLFLLKEGKGPRSVVEAAQNLLYKPFHMGPFSVQLYSDLDLLKSLDLIKTTSLEYHIADDEDFGSEDNGSNRASQVESSQFELTENGLLAGEELFRSLKRKGREDLKEFKEFFNSLPLRQLLIFVYQKYPNYTQKSKIRGQLGL